VAERLSLKDYSAKIVGLLLVVEAVSVYFLWALDPTNKLGQAIFAIFLAIDLVSFSIMSYVYRSYKKGDELNRGLLLAGCAMILLLVYASLAL
jgi:hypothetical protein